MGASRNIRAGKRAAYAALEKAGLNTQPVEMLILLTASDARNVRGLTGNRTYARLTLSPTPESVLNSRIVLQLGGTEWASDLTLKGAFPESLAGHEVTLDENGNTLNSVQLLKNYASPADFQQDLETAERFIVNGLSSYVLQGAGSLRINQTQSEWTLHLTRLPKEAGNA